VLPFVDAATVVAAESNKLFMCATFSL